MSQPRVAPATLLLALIACGGKSPTNPSNPPAGSSNFRATIDGTAWASLGTTAAAVGSANGTFSIAGGSSSGTGMALNFFNIAGPGTYPIGVGPTVPGGLASLTNGGSAWTTPLSGAAGTVTFTTVSATKLTGTFSYTAGPATGSTTGNRAVTSGSFDLPVTTATSVAMAANAGSRFSGTINGTPWNAATIVMSSRPTSGTLFVSIVNTSYQLVLSLSGFTGPGTYALGTGVQRTLLATQLGPNTSWGGPGSTSTGSFVVTTSSPARVGGTFDVTLPPSTLNAGAGNLRLVGTFDLGIP